MSYLGETAYIFNMPSLYKHLLVFQLKIPTILPKNSYLCVCICVCVRACLLIKMLLVLHSESIVNGTWMHPVFENSV